MIDFLDEQLHAAIVGVAGTGKTLLAIEKARRIACPAEPVLFLCYNSALAQHLRAYHSQPNVQYLTFHGLTRAIVGSEGSLELAEEALIEHFADDGPMPWEHVIVDEGHDFKKAWLEFLQYRFRSGAFYVFYDRYQTIQGEKDTGWIDQIPCRLVLTRNCRNTDPIARLAYRAGGITVTPRLGLDGPHPILHRVGNVAEALRLVGTLVEAACTKHKIPPHEVAVITLETLENGSPWCFDRIGGQLTSDTPEANRVTVTTVRRFKGLEAALVLVVDVDFTRAVDEEWRRRLYVACSRARHAVHIITTNHEQDLSEALRVFAGSQKIRTSWRTLSRLLAVHLGGENIDPFNEPEVG